MPRQEINRSGEMEVFVRAVELGGFSPAARALRMTPSAVSKLVARLEKRLGARLVNRSTRKLLLTAEGQAFVERAHRVLADLDEAERAVAAGAVGAEAVVAAPCMVGATLLPSCNLSTPVMTTLSPGMSPEVISD